MRSRAGTSIGVIITAALSALVVTLRASADDSPSPERPLMRDFIGLCVHTVQFKPKLYAPVTRSLRDYHNISWDLGKDPNHAATFPLARNRVNWGTLYGSWKEAGYRTQASLMFHNIEPGAWMRVTQ